MREKKMDASLYTLYDPEKELNKLGCDQTGIALMAPKSRYYNIKVRRVPLPDSFIIKQEALSQGAEAAIPARTMNNFVQEPVDIFIMGTERQLEKFASKLKLQHGRLAELGKEIIEIVRNRRTPPEGLKMGRFHLPLGKKTLIMGILNVTPDSFSDGGSYNGIEDAVKQARRMADEGADIIDIGGESTRPGADPVGSREELSRVMPVIKALKEEKSIKLPLSIDTYKGEVAEEALKAGVEMINDVWGLQKDPEVARSAARHEAVICLMHNRDNTDYDDLIADITVELKKSIDLAIEEGIPEKDIIIDPGIGFGKDLQQNLEVMRHLQDLKSLGYPILLGTSRKSMIGKTLDLPVADRLEGTAATVAYGIAAGVEIIRVHDVKEMSRVSRMTDAIVRR